MDLLKHQGLRRRLVEELREKGLYGAKVLKAMEAVPRHLFIESNAFLEYAYKDVAFPIAAGQTISQPSTVALQTTLLHIEPRDKVLEIGTGSGYQTAVLCEMKAKVYSIERQKQLYDKSRQVFKTLGYRLRQQLGDGYKGWAPFAPFDKILVTCGAPYIPQALVHQLKVGGEMVIPVGEEQQEMLYIYKVNETEIRKEVCGSAAFVPMLKNVNVGK